MARTPDYQRIANDIRMKITAGELGPGDRLPSISQLQRQYSVSAQPVKSALLVLQTEGIVEGHQGRGVFVTDRSQSNSKPLKS
jgi:DNA-binding GntR family transcriptional regulator